MLISLIVPCYNEQEALPIFYEESTKVLAGMDCEYEFLFVNDGSKDATLSILKDLAERDEHVTYLSFSRNFGKEAAMYAGFTNAKGDYVAVMDADMQDPPALLPQMLALLTSGDYQPDLRCGYRGRCPRFQTDEAGDGGCDRGDGRIQPLFQGNLWMDRF